MVDVLTWVGVTVFGAFGAAARFQVDSAVSARLPGDFPLGTLVVNLTGSFALGVLVGASATHRIALVLGTGFTGGYTTFSTWMVETQRLGEDGEWLIMGLYLLGSMVAGLVAAAAAWMLGGALT